MSNPPAHQADMLLTTKLNPPPIRSDILDRPHLVAKLEQNIRRPLTVIAAPAGYGKSTLAAQWLKINSLPGTWISLDERDNDTRVFLSYFVAAVRRIQPHACSHTHNLLEASVLPPSDVLAKLLANDLEEINKPFLLVLDDYHLVTNPDINDILDRLLQHPPRSLHLVIVTRHDPPFLMVSMKARGLVVEIRESKLQFDATETGLLLQRVGNINLNEKGLTHIMNDIEGWVTGLRLYCLAMDKNEHSKDYIVGTGGDSTDYLVQQVLSNQPPQMQDCMLKTSILDRFCASLCEAICSDPTGENAETRVIDGHKFIQTISDAKLFGIQLEAGGEWIRYHHLFQKLLRKQLSRSRNPQEIEVIHRKAAIWFGEQGLIAESLKHALLAGDTELATSVIENARMQAINNDGWTRLGKWLDALPPGIEETRPYLLMCRAYLLLYSAGHVEKAPAILDKVVELAGESPADPMLAGELLFFRGIPAFRKGKFDVAKQLFNAALDILPEANEEARSLSEMYSHLMTYLEGNKDLALEGLRTAIRRNEPHSLHYRGRLVYGLSYINALAGQWPESFGAAEYLISFSQPNDLTFAVAWGAYLQGNASLQMLDLEKAERRFGEAFEHRYIKNQQAAMDGLVGRALCQELRGMQAEADECLDEARVFAYWTGDPARIDIFDSASARINLLRGNNDAAARWLTSCQWKPDLPIKMFYLEYPEITACRVLVSRGLPEDLEQAAARLESLELESRQFHHNCQLVPILVMKSLLAFKQDRLSDALITLNEAVDLSWPGRWMLPFIEGGQIVADLLRLLPENPEWGGFVGRTLARFDQGSGGGPMRTPEAESKEALIIDLTNRETDVLELLCERLYDKEIADRLFISPATVKTHLSHIYGKLEVANRREAAKKARQLGLV